MMMETAVYTRQFLYAQELRERRRVWAHPVPARGALPGHGALAALLGRACRPCGTPPTPSAPCWPWPRRAPCAVHCFGSGRDARGAARGPTATPIPSRRPSSSSAAPDLCAEVTRTLFHCARPYMESFVVYGENACYEWQMEDEDPMLFRMSPVAPGRGAPGDGGAARAAGPRRPAAALRSAATRGALSTATTNSTSPSSRAAGTTARTRTWCTSSCAASSRSARRASTPSPPPTGPPPASAPTSRP